MEKLNRREFVSLTAAALAGACAFCNAGMLLADSAGAGAAPVEIGALADYAKDGITDTWASSQRFFVVRENHRLFAVSATCTHKSKTTKLRDGQIYCPAHGSRFSPEGKVEKGPARKSLVHLGISADDSGKVRVDPSKRYEDGQWDDPGSFIQMV